MDCITIDRDHETYVWHPDGKTEQDTGWIVTGRWRIGKTGMEVVTLCLRRYPDKAINSQVLRLLRIDSLRRALVREWTRAVPSHT